MALTGTAVIDSGVIVGVDMVTFGSSVTDQPTCTATDSGGGTGATLLCNCDWTRTETQKVAWVCHNNNYAEYYTYCRQNSATAVWNSDASFWHDYGGTNLLHIRSASKNNAGDTFRNPEHLLEQMLICYANMDDGFHIGAGVGTCRIDGFRLNGYGLDPFVGKTGRHAIHVDTQPGDLVAITGCQDFYGSSHMSGVEGNSLLGGGTTVFVECKFGLANYNSSGVLIALAYDPLGGTECIWDGCEVVGGTLPDYQWYTAPFMMTDGFDNLKPLPAPTTWGGAFGGHSQGNAMGMLSVIDSRCSYGTWRNLGTTSVAFTNLPTVTDPVANVANFRSFVWNMRSDVAGFGYGQDTAYINGVYKDASGGEPGRCLIVNPTWLFSDGNLAGGFNLFTGTATASTVVAHAAIIANAAGSGAFRLTTATSSQLHLTNSIFGNNSGLSIDRMHSGFFTSFTNAIYGVSTLVDTGSGPGYVGDPNVVNLSAMPAAFMAPEPSSLAYQKAATSSFGLNVQFDSRMAKRGTSRSIGPVEANPVFL